MPVRDLIVIGGGPSGLSAAIAAKQRGLDYQVLEQGILVNSIYRFPPQMVFFTTPELLEIGGVPLVSPYEKPTRVEALRYYRRVADAFDLQIACGEKVLSVTPEDPSVTSSEHGSSRSIFAVETRSSRGVRRVRHARAVVFAIGYFDHPNRLNVPGEDLPHVHHYYSEPYPYYRQRVVIVGGGNSAAEAALEMYRAGAKVTMVHRRPELKSTIKYWVRPDIENRIKEGSVAARFSACLTEIRPTSVIVRPMPDTGADAEAGEGSQRVSQDQGARVESREATEDLPADAVFLLTGYRADADLMQRAGVRLNERQAPVYDPETFETNVPGLYVAGGALAGEDTGTIFIENGRFHGERIVSVIVRRLR